jgi:protein phosphatase
MRIQVGARSDIGRNRQRNEDSYLVEAPLFAVADGMGGHRGGDVASSMTLEALAGKGDGRTLTDLVEEIKEANRKVFERGEADRDLRGMGTTVTAFLTGDDKGYIAHVGDSRAYLLRAGALQQLTEDHTLVQRLVDDGRLTEDEAASHPQRNILTRALGVEGGLEVDQLTLDLQSGDRILLCSDGLSSMLSRDAIQEVLEGEPDTQGACERLVDAANRAGGEDNITVVLIDVLGDQDGAVGGPGRRGTETAVAPVGGALAEADGHAASRERGRAHEHLPESTEGTVPTRWVKPVVWSVVVVVVIAAGLLAAKLYVDHQWYVGESDGTVAIYRGLPTKVLGVRLSHVAEATTVPAASAERLQYWKGLKDGIPVSDLAAARQLVAQIQSDVGSGSGPGPATSPSPSTTPSSTASASPPTPSASGSP